MKGTTVEQAKVLKEYKALEKKLGRVPVISDFKDYQENFGGLYSRLEGLRRKKLIK